MRLILFDIDGTLIWPRGVGRASTERAMLEVFGTTGGLGTHQFGGKTDWFTLVELLSESGYDEAAVGKIMPHYEQVIQRHLSEIIGDFVVEACPGALATVQQLQSRQDAVIGIVTGNVSTTAPLKLRAAGFDPTWFKVGAYGSEALDRNRLPFLALERAIQHCGGAITPENVMIVGDTPADIECARALGAVAIAVETGFSNRETLLDAQPDMLLTDLQDFSALL